MNMKIKKLEWDSSFFNLEIGEIEINQPNKVILNNLFDVIYVKQKKDFPLQIQGFSNIFQETKVIFSKVIKDPPLTPTTDVIDFDETPLENVDLYELSYLSGHYSRFLLDKKFGIDKFRELYRMWIDNSINKKFAKRIFYTKDNNIITGFVTYKEENEIGKIGLIATLPNYQGIGIGRRLLASVEQHCKENNIKILDIPTQKENINACGFYTSCRYSIKEELIIKHYWKNNDTI